MAQGVTVAVFLATIQDVAFVRKGIYRTSETLLVVNKSPRGIGHNHIGHVEIFGLKPTKRVCGPLIVAAVVVGVKVILTGVPAALTPVGPALHREGHLRGSSGSDLNVLFGNAILNPFQGDDLEPTGGNRESFFAACDEEPVTLAARFERIVKN